MHSNSRQERMKSVPWKSRLKQLETRSSRNLQLKKHNVVLKLNSKKISETNFMYRRLKRQHKLRSERKPKSVSEFERNCRLQKNSKWDLKLKELRKRSVWKMNSSVSWWKNSQRMNDLSRWMLRGEECVNRNTSVKLKDSGRINLPFIKSKEQWKRLSKKDKSRRN